MQDASDGRSTLSKMQDSRKAKVADDDEYQVAKAIDALAVDERGRLIHEWVWNAPSTSQELRHHSEYRILELRGQAPDTGSALNGLSEDDTGKLLRWLTDLTVESGPGSPHAVHYTLAVHRELDANRCPPLPAPPTPASGRRA
jgi:hypothetical protein